MFVESTSFAAGATAGVLAVKAGSAALSFRIVATPPGWVGLIIGGVIVAGVATTISVSMDNLTKENSGRWYDDIMEFIAGI